jgi:hypothetical protein
MKPSKLSSLLSIMISLIAVVALAREEQSPKRLAHERVPPLEGSLQNAGFDAPIAFEPNRGQAPAEVKYLARAASYELFITNNEVVIVTLVPSRRQPPRDRPVPHSPTAFGGRSFSRRTMSNSLKLSDFHSEVVRLTLKPGAKTPLFDTAEPLSGRVNYLVGNDPRNWNTHIPLYGRLIERNVWPGIDITWHGNHGRLEHDFVVAPGADPAQICLSVDASSRISLDANGDLTIGSLKLARPIVYQRTGADRKVVNSRYVVSREKNSAQRVRFQIASYDRTRPLVIDPTVKLAYSTFLGGSGSYSGFNFGFGIAVDSSGSAYVTGYTLSPKFPTKYPFQAVVDQNPAGDVSPTVFVTKFTPNGTGLVYSTYLGGCCQWTDGNPEFGNSIAVDSASNAYVTGFTQLPNFPTVNAFQAQNRGNPDGTGAGGNAFVAKLSADGSSLIYSTYLGGTGGEDQATGIAVDPGGSAYVTGWTDSTDFPTENPFQAINYACIGGCGNGINTFVTKFSPEGSSLVYSSYLGGHVQNKFSPVFLGSLARGIAVDTDGSAYVTGSTTSSDFPMANAYQSSLKASGGNSNAFVTKFSADGSSLLYSTFLGGSVSDVGVGVAVDANGSAYVSGQASSPDFPLHNPFQSSLKSANGEAFLTKLSPDGTSLIYSTYLGGTGPDGADSIAVDSSDSAYIKGWTFSSDFPTVNAFQDTNKNYTCSNPSVGCGPTAFAAKFTADGSALVYSTYVGGSHADEYDAGPGLPSLALDRAGNAYFVGLTASRDFPLKRPFQKSYASTFVTKLSAFMGPSPVPTPPPTPSLTVSPDRSDFGTIYATAASKIKKLTIRNRGSVAVQLGAMTLPPSFVSSNDTCSNAPLAAKGKCGIDVAFKPSAPVGWVSEALLIPNDAVFLSATLQGTANAVTLSAPAIERFESAAAGSTSKSKAITIENRSDADVLLSAANVTLNFQIVSDTCSNSMLGARTQCRVSVEFAPQAGSTQVLSGTLSYGFTYGTNNGNVAVPLAANPE